MSHPDRTPTTWHLTSEQRRVMLERRRDELNAWRTRHEMSVDAWSFTTPLGQSFPLTLGAPWPVVDQTVADGPVVLEACFRVPDAWAGEPVELELDVSGEGFVTLSTGARGGLNPYHRAFPVTAEPGTDVRVRVEAVPKGLFGSRVEHPRLAVARLVAPEEDVRRLVSDLSVVLDAARALTGHDVVPHLLTVAEDAVRGIQWPSGAEAYLTRLDAGLGGWNAGGLWTMPTVSPRREALTREHLASVREARSELRAGIERVRQAFPPVGALALSGHAHLDLAWLWPVAESKRKAERTFETALGLMERDAVFTFNQSSAQLYAWLEEERPDLFARVRTRVLEGRVEPVGGMWVEPDCQMTGGESLARQLLYGQAYFASRFGQRSTVAWLPDTFGFTPALPQLLLEAGITGFFTTKLSWNETTPFPHDLWLWEGLDGSRVVAHAFKNDFQGAPALGSYNGDIAPEHLLRVRGHDRAKHLSAWRHRAAEALFTFGFGDGAGGPSREMLERFELLQNFPALPRLRHSRVDAFFDTLPREGLPVWVGELYLELHRGTLSSQGRVKSLNRQVEHRLLEAEAAATLAWWASQPAGEAFAYPAAELEGTWKTLLLHQFHDILPGSSVREVYEDAHPALEAARDAAARVRDEALRFTVRNDPGWVTVWNAALAARPLRVTLPSRAGEARVVTADGRDVPVQDTRDGLLVEDAGILVPPLGCVELRMLPNERASAAEAGSVSVTRDGDHVTLENDVLTVTVAPDGTLAGVTDRVHGREVLAGPGNRLVVFHDVPRAWEAWDVNPDTQDPELGETLRADDMTVVASGPVRAAVRVTWRWRESVMVQEYRLTRASRRVEIVTRADWCERRSLVKAFFSLNVRTDAAVFETAFGVTTRPTHRNQASDAARFEVSAHRFVDVSEPGYGVSVLNDGKYGHSVLGSVVGVTLLRGPVFPDPTADLGAHDFTYALLPHGRDWVEGGTVLEAFDLNSPLVVTAGRAGGASVPVTVEGLPVMLGALKKAEAGTDGAVILRFYEPHGARGQVRLCVPPAWCVERVNLLEEAPRAGLPAPQRHTDGWVLAVRPFEVVTLRLTPLAGD